MGNKRVKKEIKVIVEIKRTYNPRQTLGEWEVFDDIDCSVYKCKSLELYFNGNKSFSSCIPEGRYLLRKVKRSKAFKYEHFEILDVPNRWGIKIHIANYSRQLQGCIAVGKNFTDIDGDNLIDVTSSRKTLNELLKILPNYCKIDIREK